MQTPGRIHFFAKRVTNLLSAAGLTARISNFEFVIYQPNSILIDFRHFCIQIYTMSGDYDAQNSV